ncbi:MAG: tetratricopeptide repeat protein [Planctomycetaceae bacterium]|nr:tetratricopeptide repeat protein [Planctomycetaceae bacterium]
MKKLSNVLLLAAGFSLASGCSSTGTRGSWVSRMNPFHSKSETQLVNGEEHTVSSEFKASKKLLKKDPEGTNLAFAAYMADNGNLPEARQRYQDILANNPDCMEAELGLIRIELETGRVTQAEEMLNRLNEQHPNNLEVQRQLGQMYAQRQDWSSAIRVLQAAVEAHPKEQMAAYDLGIACVHAGELDLAMSSLTFAVGESAAMYNIGYILGEAGKIPEAVAWYQRALGSHPDDRTKLAATTALAELGVPASKIAPGHSGDSMIARQQATQPAGGSSASLLQQSVETPSIASARVVQHPIQTTSWSNSTAPPAGPSSVPVSSASSSRVLPQTGQSAAYAPVTGTPSWNGPTGAGVPGYGTGTTANQSPPVWRSR